MAKKETIQKEPAAINATQSKIDQLIPDDLNANKGTEFGQHLIEKSLRELGAGRSILLDKNNRIIAGNKTVENAAAIGLENIIIVETTGDQIVAVKRTDIDLDSERGRSLALADNATSKANLAWDEQNLQTIGEQWGVDVEDWGIVDNFSETDYSEKNKEIDVEDLAEGVVMKFKFTDVQYQFVRDELMKISGNAESALLKLLRYGE